MDNDLLYQILIELKEQTNLLSRLIELQSKQRENASEAIFDSLSSVFTILPEGETKEKLNEIIRKGKEGFHGD